MTELEEQIKQYKQRQEELIEMYGFVIQNVNGGVDKFSYTIGRNDKGDKDFLLLNAVTIAGQLLYEIVDVDKTDKLVDGKIYESSSLTVKLDSVRRTRFRVKKVQLKDYAHLVLGIANRYREEDHVHIELYLVEIGNESNNFPEEVPQEV